MAWIQRPDGANEIEIPNVGWVAFPDGVNEIELPDSLFNEQKPTQPRIDSDSSIGDMIGQSIDNTANFLKAGYAQSAANINAIPANLYEALGYDAGAKSSREGQKYWQDVRSTAMNELTGSGGYNETVADVGTSLFAPETLLTLGAGTGANTTIQTGKGLGNLLKSNTQAAMKPTSLTQTLKTPAQFGGIGAADMMAHRSATGDMSGVNWDDVSDVAVAAGIGAVAPAVLVKGAKGLYNVSGRPFSGVSNSAYTVGKDMGLSQDQVERLIKKTGIADGDQQALFLSEIGGSKTKGLRQGAIRESDDTATAYGANLTRRYKQAANAVGKANHSDAASAIDNQYEILTERSVSESTGQQVTMNRGNIVEKLENVRNSFLTTPQEGAINGIINRINGGEVNSVEKAIESYRALNEIYRKAKNRTDRRALDVVKKQVSKYIKENGSEGTFKMFEKSNENFSRLMKQEKAMKLLDDATKKLSEGSQYGEVKGVNWTKLRNTLKEEKIDSPESNALFELAERYSKKFSTSDYASTPLTATRPVDDIYNVSTTVGGTGGRLAIQEFISYLSKYIPFSNKSSLRKATKSIARAIREGGTPQEVLDKVKQSQFTSSRINRQTSRIQAVDNARAMVDNNVDAPIAREASESSIPNNDIPMSAEDEAHLFGLDRQVDQAPAEQVEIPNLQTSGVADDIARQLDSDTNQIRTAEEATVADIEASEARRLENRSEFVREINNSGNEGFDTSGGIIRSDGVDRVSMSHGSENHNEHFTSIIIRNLLEDGQTVRLNAMNGSTVRLRPNASDDEIRDAVNKYLSRESVEPREVNRADLNNIGESIARGDSINYSGGARAYRNDDGVYEITTSASSSRQEIQTVVQNVLEHQGIVKVTNSDGRVVKNIQNMNEVDEYLDAAARNRTTTRPNPSHSASRGNIPDDVTSDFMRIYPDATVTSNSISIPVEQPNGSMRTATWHNRNGVWTANTTAFNRGSGGGGKAYLSVFDLVEKMGDKTRPTSGMYPVNRFRMTMNMLKYISERDSDASHVLFTTTRDGQLGVPNNLNGQPLTRENALVVAKEYVKWINRNIFEGVRGISHNTTNARLQELSNQFQRQTLQQGSRRRVTAGGYEEPQVIFSYENLKMLRKLLQDRRRLNGNISNSQAMAIIGSIALTAEQLSNQMDEL